MPTRRAILAALAGTAAGLATGRAPGYPDRAVTVVVPFRSGGAIDTLAWLYADAATSSLGRTVGVDNRGGAFGMAGTASVARAEPDGHTLVLGTDQTHAINQNLLKDCPYDALRDFVPVAGIADIPHVLVTRKDLRIDSVAELVATGRQMPDYLYYGSAGDGFASHLAGELFKLRTGADIRHVPFPTAAPLMTGLVARRLDLGFAALPGVIGAIAAGELKALAIAGGRRAEALPDVPTMREAGIEGVEADGWIALFAPAGTPAEVVDRLHRAAAAVFSAAATRQALAAQGFTAALRSPPELAARLAGDVGKWAEVIRAAHVSVD